jgi:hypothetical protein
MADDIWTDRLSEYLDEELTSGERAAVEAHLQECADCRCTLAELRDVVSRAASLQATPPRTDLWRGIEARISEGSAARNNAGHRRFVLTLPQLAAAALLLIVTSAGLSWVIWTRMFGDARPSTAFTAQQAPAANSPEFAVRPLTFADPAYDAAIVDLERILEEGRGRLDPRTVAVLERNLATIDTAIKEARDALEADPANDYLNSYVADARRRKLELLRTAASAVASLPI